MVVGWRGIRMVVVMGGRGRQDHHWWASGVRRRCSQVVGLLLQRRRVRMLRRGIGLLRHRGGLPLLRWRNR